MRDAINFLDQLVAYDNKVITLDDIYKVNGSVSYNDIYLLLKSIADNNKVEIIRFLIRLIVVERILISLLLN